VAPDADRPPVAPRAPAPGAEDARAPPAAADSAEQRRGSVASSNSVGRLSAGVGPPHARLAAGPAAAPDIQTQVTALSQKVDQLAGLVERQAALVERLLAPGATVAPPTTTQPPAAQMPTAKQPIAWAEPAERPRPIQVASAPAPAPALAALTNDSPVNWGSEGTSPGPEPASRTVPEAEGVIAALQRELADMRNVMEEQSAALSSKDADFAAAFERAVALARVDIRAELEAAHTPDPRPAGRPSNAAAAWALGPPPAVARAHAPPPAATIPAIAPAAAPVAAPPPVARPLPVPTPTPASPGRFIVQAGTNPLDSVPLVLPPNGSREQVLSVLRQFAGSRPAWTHLTPASPPDRPPRPTSRLR